MIPTPLLFLFPERYVEDEAHWKQAPLAEWSDVFVWEQDGFLDTVTDPTTTWFTRRGDCDDYTLVVACILKSRDVRGAGIACLWDDKPWPTHAVAYDTEHVYSSGAFLDMTLTEYVNNNEYHSAFTRQL